VDELGSWFEVIRSLMPPSFDVRIVWDVGAIVVAAQTSEHMVWLYSDDLSGRAPGEVVEQVRTQLQYANLPGHALVA
jgi:hypothetical protein